MSSSASGEPCARCSPSAIGSVGAAPKRRRSSAP
ncbi:MAG: hypothetical protein E6H77_02590 [Betaproteobacteria bacterium]|nr:MAG: hypothetical protein E6H77_02590 [Betaproteobacteria bacterium]